MENKLKIPFKTDCLAPQVYQLDMTEHAGKVSILTSYWKMFKIIHLLLNPLSSLQGSPLSLYIKFNGVKLTKTKIE